MATSLPDSKYSSILQEISDRYVSEDYMKNGDVIPTIEGMAKHIKVAVSTLRLWRDDERKPAFKETFERCKSEQCRLVINKGLKNEFSPTIAKLILGNHGFREKTEQEISGPGGGPQNDHGPGKFGQDQPLPPEKDGGDQAWSSKRVRPATSW